MSLFGESVPHAVNEFRPEYFRSYNFCCFLLYLGSSISANILLVKSNVLNHYGNGAYLASALVGWLVWVILGGSIFFSTTYLYWYGQEAPQTDFVWKYVDPERRGRRNKFRYLVYATKFIFDSLVLIVSIVMVYILKTTHSYELISFFICIALNGFAISLFTRSGVGFFIVGLGINMAINTAQNFGNIRLFVVIGTGIVAVVIIFFKTMLLFFVDKRTVDAEMQEHQQAVLMQPVEGQQAVPMQPVGGQQP